MDQKNEQTLHFVAIFLVVFFFFTCIVPEGVAEVNGNLVDHLGSSAGVRQVGRTTITSSSSKGKDGKHLQGRRKNFGGEMG